MECFQIVAIVLGAIALAVLVILYARPTYL